MTFKPPKTRKNMRSLLLLTVLIVPLLLQSAPARPGQWRVKQPDGTTLTLWLSGDERMHCYMTTDTVPVCETPQGYCYATAADGRLTPSQHLAHDPEHRTQRENNFIRQQKQSLHQLLLDRQAARLQLDNSRRAARLPAARMPERPRPYAGSRRGLVILVGFADLDLTYTHSYFNRRFNEEGFSDNGCIGSVSDYFREQSYGQFELSFDVAGPVKLANEYAYYGRNEVISGDDKRPREMVIEACQAVDKDIDFSQYDWDGDGTVEQVFVIYAGYGENAGASANTIWPHEYCLGRQAIELDGVTVDTYACSCELAGNRGTVANGIGTSCHEFSHCLGLPDLYNTNYTGGFGMGPWDLMNSGSHSGPEGNGEVPCGYSAAERWAVGWLEPTEITATQHIDDLPPLSDGPYALVLHNPANRSEFFLFENRQADRWFSYARTYSGMHGLALTHVDYDPLYWESNAVNDYPDHPHFQLVPADGSYGHTEEELAGDLFPGMAGVTTLTNTSHEGCGTRLFTPNTDGTRYMNCVLNRLEEHADGTISFDVILDHDLDAPLPAGATDIDSTGFTATWEPVGGAVAYVVEQHEQGEHKLYRKTRTVNAGQELSVRLDWLIQGSCTVKYRVKALGQEVESLWSDYALVDRRTAVDAPAVAPQPAPRYVTPDGRTHRSPQPGLNIEQRADGTAKKFFQKSFSSP